MINGKFPGLATGFSEAPAAFSPFAPALPRADAAGRSGDSPPPSDSDQQAVALWRQWRVSEARRDALIDAYDAALASVPSDLRPGKRYLGENLCEADAAAISAWPAIADAKPPKFGRIDLRPDPQTLLNIYKAQLEFDPSPGPGRAQNQAQRAERAFNDYFASVALLASRENDRRKALRAAGMDRLEDEIDAASDVAYDLEREMLALPCDGPHALAAVALIRLRYEEENLHGLVANPSLWRAILAGLRRDVTGEIAEDVEAALARADEDGLAEDEG